MSFSYPIEMQKVLEKMAQEQSRSLSGMIQFIITKHLEKEGYEIKHKTKDTPVKIEKIKQEDGKKDHKQLTKKAKRIFHRASS